MIEFRGELEYLAISFAPPSAFLLLTFGSEMLRSCQPCRCFLVAMKLHKISTKTWLCNAHHNHVSVTSRGVTSCSAEQ